MVVGSVLVAAEACQSVVEVVNTDIRSNLAISPCGQHRHVVVANDCGRRPRLGVVATAGITQIEQCQCHGRQQRDRRLESLHGGELQFLDIAAGLHALVIFLHDPATLVPACDPPGIVEGCYRFVRQQQPLDSFLARGRMNFREQYSVQRQGGVTMLT
jgi:hypothetical protein